jgi:hypothetical protein
LLWQLLLLLLLHRLRKVIIPQPEQQCLADNQGPGLGQVESLTTGRPEHLQTSQERWELIQGLQEHLNVVSKLAARDTLGANKNAKPFCLQVLHQSLTYKQVELRSHWAALTDTRCKLHHPRNMPIHTGA